ncbi:MAG: hypothetical protein ACI965_000758 [Paraglaciecola sp.]|jgi:uncharacterized protein (TIGR03545 family)
MKNIIRWPGLIAFIVITGLLSAISIVFLDFWIKVAAENSLEAATGAEVNIAKVSHSFSPFGVTLEQVQLTDPKQPTHNQAQVASISARVNLPPLLLRKLIIDKLTIRGLEVNQLRGSVGKVYRQPKSLKAFSQGLLPDPKDLPDVDDILAKSPLKTTRAIKEVQQAYGKHSEKLKQQYKHLPEQSKLADYKRRLEALSRTDYKNPLALAAAKKEFDGLKGEILQDKQKFGDFKQSVSEAKQDLSPKLARLKVAPDQDYQQLQSLITGDADAIKDVTTLVFGDKVGQWSEYALAAFEIAGPMLANRGEQHQERQKTQGRWLEFSDTSALPDLLIRNASVTLSWEQENIVSEWQDITHQHNIIGRPTLFKVDSGASKLWQSLKVDGDFWLKEQGAKAQQTWDLRGLKLADVGLLDQQKLSSTLLKGLLNSRGKLAVDQDQVSGTGLVDLQQLVMAASGSNRLTNVIAQALTQLNTLAINTDLGGTLDDIVLSFRSDLDKQLASALLANLSSEQKGKLDELKHKLNAKIQGPLGQSKGEMSQWLDLEKLAEGNLSNINDMLSSKFSDAVDSKKDQIKDKLKDKLKNKLFG